jgi:hypothetical protein
MEQGVMKKFARIVTGVFEAWPSHVRGKEVLQSKISMGGCTQVTIGLTELMGGECLWMSQRSERIYNVIQKSSRRLQDYTYVI